MTEFDTINDLIASSPVIGEYYYVAGHHTVGDGGGGHFLMRSSNANIRADNGTVFDVTGGQLHRILPDDTVTAQMFGAVGNGTNDDTVAVQSAINWAIENRKRCRLYDALAVFDTIQISDSAISAGNEVAIQVQQVTIDMDLKHSLGASGDALIWRGEADRPIVEAHIVQRSQISLNLSNPDQQKTGVTGFLWHNPDSRGLASNGNSVSLSVTGCNLGVHLGDQTNDGYASNIDDNRFPAMWFFRCKQLLLVDSVRTDNNVIDRFHGGGGFVGDEIPRDREYLIRILRSGNGFKIIDGFARTDKMIHNNAVIDVQRGTFSCDKFSLEGFDENDDEILPLFLRPDQTRDKCIIRQFYTGPNTRNAEGVAIDNRAESGAVFIGCSLGGNLKTILPIVALGNTFQANGDTSFGIVRNGNRATYFEAGLGVLGDQNQFVNGYTTMRAIGSSAEILEVTTRNVFPEVSRHSIFRKKLTENTIVKPTSAAIENRDAGREITFVFIGDSVDRTVSWDSRFKLLDGTQTTDVPANKTVVMKFLFGVLDGADSERWQQTS